MRHGDDRNGKHENKAGLSESGLRKARIEI